MRTQELEDKNRLAGSGENCINVLEGDKTGDAVGRPGWESSLLGDPGAKFFCDLPKNHVPGQLRWPVLTCPPLAAFEVTPEAYGRWCYIMVKKTTDVVNAVNSVEQELGPGSRNP